MAKTGLAQLRISPLFRGMTILMLAVLFVNLVSPISVVQAAAQPAGVPAQVGCVRHSQR